MLLSRVGICDAIYDGFHDRRVRRFWALGLIALVLHGVLDPLITYFVVNVFQVGVETNHLMAGYLEQGPLAFAAIHLPLYVLVFLLLCGFTWLFSQATEAEATRIYMFSLVAWAGIIIWGLFLVLNNLLVLIS